MGDTIQPTKACLVDTGAGALGRRKSVWHVQSREAELQGTRAGREEGVDGEEDSCPGRFTPLRAAQATKAPLDLQCLEQMGGGPRDTDYL